MDTNDIKQYYCPMKCEGEKIYGQPRDCPVCNMHLVSVEENDKHNHHHHTEHHHEHSNDAPSQGNDKYYCPMRCEGDKTYDKPGDCPVCNMHLIQVDGKTEQGQHSTHHGQEHVHNHTHTDVKSEKYYCTMLCEGDKTYPKPGDCPVCGMHLQKLQAISKPGVIYTCPMHPEVKQDKPGSCPKCGMDLVPEKVQDTDEEEKAYHNMVKKFRIALIFAIPVFILGMSDFFTFLHIDSLVSKRVLGWVELLLATPVVFYSGWKFFKRGWSSIIRWAPNMWTLISIGVGAAYLFSVFALLFPGIFPAQFKDIHGNVHLYFEAAAVVLTLVLFGQVLELKAHSKTNSAIKALLNLVPPVARIIRDGKEKEIPLEQVKVR